MPKKQKGTKKLRKETKRIFKAKDLNNDIVPDLTVHEPRNRYHSIFLDFARNPKLVGALESLLTGCFAGGGFIAVCFIFPQIGILYERTCYLIASFAPKNFIPPNVYIPGIFLPLVMLLILAGFAGYGYKKGSTPPMIELNKDSRSIKEKIFEFIFLFVICFALVVYRYWSEHPGLSFTESILNPFIIGLLIIVLVGLSFYVFSREQSPQFLMFVLRTGIAVGFLLFVLGLNAYTIFQFFLHALNR